MKERRNGTGIVVKLAAGVLFAPFMVHALAQSTSNPNRVEIEPAEVQSQAAAPQLTASAEVKPVNQRLYLTDGSYQTVRQMERKGERVRYLSAERGEWEEIPAGLVDWERTNRWQQEHTLHDPSPGMKAAAEMDRKEAERKQEATSLRPEVVAGLELPDQDGVFALDEFEAHPELVEVRPSALDFSSREKKGLATLNPLAGQRARLEIEGARAKVHLHTRRPEFYISVEGVSAAETPGGQAFVVDTGNAREVTNRRHGASSARSGFALVRLNERQAVRFVGAVHVSLRGEVTQSEDVIPATTESFGGRHWLRIRPNAELPPGEYALVEILSAEEMNQNVWDFSIRPESEENPGAMVPLIRPAKTRPQRTSSGRDDEAPALKEASPEE